MGKSPNLKKMINEVNDIIEQTYYYEQSKRKLESKIEDNKKRISKSMGRKTRLKCDVEDDLSFTACKEKKSDISFFEEKLKETLDKKTFNQVVNKNVSVNDVNGLIKMLKSYGVPPKEFKKFINVEEKADHDRIDHLIEVGDISIEDLQGCYEAEISEEIIVKKNK